MRAAVWIGAALVVVGLLPVALAFLAGGIASAAGCVLHEGFANPCMIGGTDWGETLYTLFVMGWLALVTLPAAGLGLALLLGAGIVAAIRRGRR